MENTRLVLAALVAASVGGLYRNAEADTQVAGGSAPAPTEENQASAPGTLTQKFNFKSRKITNDAGEEIGKTKKHPSILVTMPVPTADELIGYLSTPEGAVAKLILSAVNGIVADQVRSQFDDLLESYVDDTSKELSVNDLDFGKLTLDYIATIPATQRGGTALTEEDFKAFFGDYLVVMVAATGKEEKRIQAHIELFKRPQKARAQKEILALLVSQLDIYLATSANLEDTGEVANRLRGKFQKWHDEPEKAVDLDLL